MTIAWIISLLLPEEFTAGNASSWNSRMVGRLKPGITAEQAQSDAERVARETMATIRATCAVFVFTQW